MTGQDKVGARWRPSTWAGQGQEGCWGGLRFFIGEQGNKQVVA